MRNILINNKLSLKMNRDKIAKVFGPTWVDFMAPFVDSKEFDNILDKLKTLKSENNAVIFPEPNLVFKCFQDTPLDTLRVVIVGQEPYVKAGYSTGLAFAIPKDISPIPPSFQKFVDGIEADCYSGLDFDKNSFDTTLSDWTKQGILLLNSALTVEENKPGSHSELWAPFMKFFFDRLNSICRDLVICPIGSLANDVVRDVLIFAHFTQPKCEHPAAAAMRKEAWKCTHFSAANAIITAHRKGELIKW